MEAYNFEFDTSPQFHRKLIAAPALMGVTFVCYFLYRYSTSSLDETDYFVSPIAILLFFAYLGKRTKFISKKIKTPKINIYNNKIFFTNYIKNKKEKVEELNISDIDACKDYLDSTFIISKTGKYKLSSFFYNKSKIVEIKKAITKSKLTREEVLQHIKMNTKNPKVLNYLNLFFVLSLLALPIFNFHQKSFSYAINKWDPFYFAYYCYLISRIIDSHFFDLAEYTASLTICPNYIFVSLDSFFPADSDKISYKDIQEISMSRYGGKFYIKTKDKKFEIPRSYFSDRSQYYGVYEEIRGRVFG